MVRSSLPMRVAIDYPTLRVQNLWRTSREILQEIKTYNTEKEMRKMDIW